MEASGGTKRRHLLGVVCATAVIGCLLAPAQTLAGGSLSADPSSLNFGNVGVGSTSSLSVTINNTGSNLIGDDTISSSEFVTDSACDGMTVSSGNPCTIQVTFSPTSAGSKMATLSVPSDGSNTVMVNLSGFAQTISLTLSPAMFDFGSVPPGMQSAPQTFTATSDGDGMVAVGGVTIAGTNAGQFQRTGGTCMPPPFMLAPTNSCTVDIAFAPTTFGAMAATLQFTSNAPDTPDTAALSGTTPAAPLPPIVPLAPIVPTTPTTPPKRCKKGFKLKRGKCVRKKRKKK